MTKKEFDKLNKENKTSYEGLDLEYVKEIASAELYGAPGLTNTCYYEDDRREVIMARKELKVRGVQ